MANEIPDNVELRKRLADLVRECIATTNSASDAARLLLSRARTDSAMWGVLMGNHEMDVSLQAVSAQIRSTRREVWTRPTGPDARVEALARAVTLMDFPLPGGKPLKSATRDEIAEASDFYLRQATDMRRKGFWLARISAAVPDGKTAGQALTELQLEQMKQETE